VCGRAILYNRAMGTAENNLTRELIRLGARLRALRLERGLTLEALATRANFSKAHLSRLEAGDRQASISAMLTLARAFDLPLTALFEDAPNARGLGPEVFPGLISLNIGQPRALRRAGQTTLSSIVKSPSSDALRLNATGLEGDAQADQKQHGGPDRAVCVYPLEHYPFWVKRLERPLEPAAFGENFSVWGLTEQSACIGDVYRIGAESSGAVVQVSEPRGLCEKLGLRHRAPKLQGWVKETGFTGFYCRVLEPGEVAPGQAIHLLERSRNAVTVAEANRAMNDEHPDEGTLERVIASRALSSGWRGLLEARTAARAGA
jgi:MOSC domain-containing protein YiiM/DNA-binding XRE family transcriptional regulator